MPRSAARPVQEETGSLLAMHIRGQKMAKVRTISLDELDRLGIDDQNNLYWDGKSIKTEEHLVLNRWVNVSVIVSAASTLTIACFEILNFLVAAHIS